MKDKSSNDIEYSSSNYFDACSNSLELNEINEEKEKKNDNIKKSELNKDFEKRNIYKSPQRISNNNFNAKTNNSSNININSSNGHSNIDKNILISTKEQTNGETDKSKIKNKISKKVNIYSMNSVKKNLMSPIEENNHFDFSNINSNEILEPHLNKINEITNNNNNNININIIINKNKKRQKEEKFNVQDIKSNKIKNLKSIQKKEEIINTDIKNDSLPLYSSLDKLSNSTISKQFEKQEIDKQNNINSINNKNSEFSYFEKNQNKIFGNSVSESIMHNKLKLNHTSLMIDTIIFKNITKDILTVDDLQLKYNLRDIQVQRKEGFIQKNKYIHTLIELQIFNFGDSPIWVMKISHHGKYLAAGNKAGKIRIYELMGYDYDKYENTYNNKNIMNYLYFINEKPIK